MLAKLNINNILYNTDNGILLADGQYIKRIISYLPAEYALKAPCGPFVVEIMMHFKANCHTSVFCITYFIPKCGLASQDDIIVGCLHSASSCIFLHIFTLRPSDSLCL